MGKQYSWLLEHGVLDERLLVQCHLAVERVKGPHSHLFPWIQALPWQ